MSRDKPRLQKTSSEKRVMPVLFIGHGSPMNAIEDNPFSKTWQEWGKKLPKPRAILCISAHWETWGVRVTAMEHPRTIHDFGGFPPELYAVRYQAPGDADLAKQVCSLIQSAQAALDQDWGFDHGCWSVLRRMFPDADVPIIQLSLDASKPAAFHYALAKELAPLRKEEILILGSGNMVHNLRKVMIRSGDLSDFNQPFGFDWAIAANDLFKKLINENRHAELVNYQALGSAVQLAIPTPEHYLPMLYALALQQDGDTLTYFNDVPLAGSLTMTSFVLNPVNS